MSKSLAYVCMFVCNQEMLTYPHKDIYDNVCCGFLEDHGDVQKTTWKIGICEYACIFVILDIWDEWIWPNRFGNILSDLLYLK